MSADLREPRRKVSLVRDEALPEDARGALQTFLMSLSVPKKVELAARGNREVRLLLSRDGSPTVARAVIASPRLDEVDVRTYAASPLTSEEVLRAIGETREWTGNPAVLGLLLANPRTPPAVSLRLLPRLPKRDLANLARNANVPAVVRREAKRLLQAARV